MKRSELAGSLKRIIKELEEKCFLDDVACEFDSLTDELFICLDSRKDADDWLEEGE